MDTKVQRSPNSARGEPGQSSKFISLSKLKNYMPDNSELISCSGNAVQSAIHAQSSTGNTQTGSSCYISRLERLHSNYAFEICYMFYSKGGEERFVLSS